MEIRELLQKRASLWEETKKFLDEHTDKDGKMSPEDLETASKMEADYDAMSKLVEHYERNARIGAELDKPFNTPYFEPFNNNSTAGKTGRASDEYRKAAIEAVRNKFSGIKNTLMTTPGSAGGFLIPTEWDTRLIKSLEEENVIRKLGTTITTNSEHKISRVATKPVASWLDEGQSISFTNGTFDQITLDAHKIGIGILISEELLADSMFDIETEILDQCSKGIANAEEESFLLGAPDVTTGKVTRPTGIITTIAANPDMYVTTAGNNPTADEIIDLTYKLPRPYRKNAVFLVNDSTLALLRKFKDQNQRYLWEESYQAGEPSTFMGYKIYTSQYMPTVATGNFPIIFGDFSFYNIADRGTRTIHELREAYVVSGHVGYMIKERLDGVLIDNNAMRAIKIK